MIKFFIISPKGVPVNPHLFPMFKPTFEAQGHTFTADITAATCVLFDLHSRISDYDQDEIDYVLSSGVPVASFDEWDRGSLSNDVWPWPLTDQQEKIFEAIDSGKNKAVHLCRLLDKTKTYPPNLHPYEKPILYYEEPLLTPDELFDRRYDVCFIANTSPQREAVAAALRSDKRLKCIISLGRPKIPFNDWVNEHKKAKLFVSVSAGGYSNERIQNLFSISVLLQERTDQLLLYPFSHSMNCLKVNQPPTQLDLQTIYEVVNDKKRLHEIYTNGYNFVRQFYSAGYIANDILQKILNHIA